jgi:hypothetical protein
MSNDLETQLEEALAARAETTTTSDDAWARVNRRGARHDHRRSVVLRSLAAAAFVAMVVGGGVALVRDGGPDSGTVATGRGADASKSVAGDSAGSSTAEVAPAAPFAPAGNGLEVQDNPDGTIVVRLGSTTTEPVQPGGISAAIDGDTVFGIAPSSVRSITVTTPVGGRETRKLIADLVPETGPYRTFRFGGIPVDVPAVTVDADSITTVARREGTR